MKPAAPTPPTATEPVWARHARRLAFLHRLAGIGMEKARALASQAAARVVDDFVRVAKAIRIAILLRRRLEELGPQDPAAPAAPAIADGPRPQPPERPEAAELAELRRAVARNPSAERDRADRDLGEPTGDPWLDRDDDLELDTLPVAALVARLCDILGVPFDPDLWAGADTPIGAQGPPARRVPPPRLGWRTPAAPPLRSAAAPNPPVRLSG
ncbi:MAG: hypothetical protein JSR86_18650 [Proteobacteria bacterium]|nr:hypothetical protein [Pseudomonadota bacterium]